MLRRKTNEAWTDKHRIVMRKNRSWKEVVHKRLSDIGWLDDKKCQGCGRRHGEAQIVPLPVEGNQKTDSVEMKDMGTKSKNTKERLEVANEER